MISQKKTIQLIVKLYVNLQVLNMLIHAVASVHIVTTFLFSVHEQLLKQKNGHYVY